MGKCIGCGIKLQNEDKDKNGYTKKIDNDYCERCFKTIHYNEERKVLDIDNNKILEKINKLSKYTIFLTDLLSLNEELIKFYKRINNEKILVVNKCDIVPNNVKLEHLEENIKSVFDIYDDVLFISAKKNYNLNRLVNIIEDKKEVIIAGETSSGKSTLINLLTGSNLTTSKYSNTTLDFIKIKYLDYIIYDSIGLRINTNKKNIDDILIKTIQMKKDFDLYLDDLVLSGLGNITLYSLKSIKINSKKSRNDKEYEYDIKDNQDIEFDNGFIFVKKSFKLKSNKELNIRDSIIKN